MVWRTAPTRSVAVAVAATVAMVCALAPSTEAAYPKKKFCGTTSAVGATMRVTINNPYQVRISYSCLTARGLMRVYARTRPSVRRYNRLILYGGRRWDCYFASDRSGYSCSVAGRSNFRVPSVSSQFV